MLEAGPRLATKEISTVNASAGEAPARAIAAPVSRSRRLLAAAGLAVAGLAVVALAASGIGSDPSKLSDWQALALGVTQGLSEFLPISSSGHLILVPWLADWHYLGSHPDFNKTFDVSLHLGTLIAVLIYFWGDIVQLVLAWVQSVKRRSIETPVQRVAWFVVVATIPAGLVGAVGESFVEEKLGEPWQIAILLALMGLVLWYADRTAERRKMEDLGLGTAVAVGAAQALALAPGVSRSGITITAGRLLGLSRDDAARFSFLLYTPVVAGAVIFKARDLLGGFPAGTAGPFLVGTLSAAIVGLVAIWALLAYVRRNGYTPFVIYRLCLAAAVLLLIVSGAKSASF
jgi:undecaprenyl-diphosphatase